MQIRKKYRTSACRVRLPGELLADSVLQGAALEVSAVEAASEKPSVFHFLGIYVVCTDMND